MLQGGDNLIEILAGTVDGQTAETVVAAEGNDDKDRLQGKHVVQPVQTVFGGVAADAGVHDM